MSYNAKQEADEIVGETELYIFDFGANNKREYYTTSRRPITWTPPGNPDANVIWYPLPIKRGTYNTNMKVGASKPKLTLPCRSQFVNLLKDGELDFLAVTILRGIGTDYDNDYKNPFFVGYVADVNASVRDVSATLETIESVFDIPLPRVVYQSLCNNVYGDSTCGGPFVFNFATVVGFDSTRRKITLNIEADPSKSDVGVGVAPHHFSLGKAWKRIEISPGIPDPNEPRSFREILFSSNNLGGDQMEVIVHAPIAGLEVGDKLNMTPGDDHSIETCILKFNRRPNFVGMSNIPTVAPVTEGF